MVQIENRSSKVVTKAKSPRLYIARRNEKQRVVFPAATASSAAASGMRWLPQQAIVVVKCSRTLEPQNCYVMPFPMFCKVFENLMVFCYFEAIEEETYVYVL